MAINFNTLAASNSEAAFVGAINSIHNRGDSLQLDVHKVLVAIAVVWERSGNYEPAVRHVNLLLTKEKLQGARKNAIRAWVEAYLGFIFAEDGENKGNFICPKTLFGGKHLELKELTNNRWWEFKVEAAYKPMAGLDPEIVKLIKRADNDRKKLGDKSAVDIERLNALRALVPVSAT